ncbi:MAG: helix-turn-helix transcriptional regulator [bacterium]|nr:helix-turn-helix transcriptional regulator [bacterium]
MMTIEQLVRAHRELALMMGYRPQGPWQETYSYEKFTNDLNTMLPHCVRNHQQMKNAMAGRCEIPPHWEQPIDQLLELAVNAHTHPPTPGPHWHPQPMTHSVRALAARRLGDWLKASGMQQRQLAMASEMTRHRVSVVLQGSQPMLPTELDRIAAVFGTDRDGFLHVTEEGLDGVRERRDCQLMEARDSLDEQSPDDDAGHDSPEGADE